MERNAREGRPMRLFSLETGRSFAAQVAAHLETSLAEHEEREFEDGEHKVRSLVNVRGCDVYVVQSLYGDARHSVNDKLCRTLFFCGALRDAAAASVTAVVPYLCYSRKDRKTKSRDPLTMRYAAAMFEAVGVDRVVAMDAHNLAAFQNAFRCPTEHLEARPLLAEFFARSAGDGPVVVASPDVGGVKRAEQFRQTLSRRLSRELSSAFMEKERSGGRVSGEAVVGNVDGATVIVIDDMIASGGTLARAARAFRQRGAARVLAAATHGVFTGEAREHLSEPALERVIVTDTIPPFRLSEQFLSERVTVLSAAPLVAEAIRCMHTGGSIVELMDPNDRSSRTERPPPAGAAARPR